MPHRTENRLLKSGAVTRKFISAGRVIPCKLRAIQFFQGGISRKRRYHIAKHGIRKIYLNQVCAAETKIFYRRDALKSIQLHKWKMVKAAYFQHGLSAFQSQLAQAAPSYRFVVICTVIRELIGVKVTVNIGFGGKAVSVPCLDHNTVSDCCSTVLCVLDYNVRFAVFA